MASTWKKIVVENGTNTIAQTASGITGTTLGDLATLSAVDSGQITNGSIDTAHIGDNQVTEAKLADAINTEIGLNTAKVTNATHTGEVTGSGVLTIADNIIDEANLKMGGAPVDGQVLTADSQEDGGLIWATPTSGDITGVTAGAGMTGGATSGSATLNVIGGDGITVNADEIEVAVDNDSIELSAATGAGTIRVKTGGVTNAMLGGSIADEKISSAATWSAKQDALTFGKVSGNALKSEEELTTNDVLLMGTDHVKGSTYAELKNALAITSTDISNVDAFSQSGNYTSLRAQATTKGDVGLGSVEDTALSTWAGTTNITTIGAATATSLDVSGALTAGSLNIDTGSVTLTGDVAIKDDIIVLNSDEAGTPSVDVGIQVERGTANNVDFYWNETSDEWSMKDSALNVYRVGSVQAGVGQSGDTGLGVGSIYIDTGNNDAYIYA